MIRAPNVRPELLRQLLASRSSSTAVQLHRTVLFSARLLHPPNPSLGPPPPSYPQPRLPSLSKSTASTTPNTSHHVRAPASFWIEAYPNSCFQGGATGNHGQGLHHHRRLQSRHARCHRSQSLRRQDPEPQLAHADGILGRSG